MSQPLNDRREGKINNVWRPEAHVVASQHDCATFYASYNNLLVMGYASGRPLVWLTFNEARLKSKLGAAHYTT